jgi:hypothetical protein
MIVDFPKEPFTVASAATLGITKRRIGEGVRRGELARLFRNVYLRTDIEVTTEMRVSAALLVISPHVVVCDRTAAWIWGVDCFRLRELEVPAALETYTLRGHRAPERPEIRGGQRDLGPQDWTTVGGLRDTTPLRTALDLGCSLPRRDPLAAMDALARAFGFTSRDLVLQLRRYARRRGVVQLRELAALVDPRAESTGESWTRLVMHDHGLPAPQVNWWVLVDGVPTFRLDLAYPLARVAVEYDGEEFHSSDEDKQADAERRDWLESHGWAVIVVDKGSFTDDAIDEWIQEVRDALSTAQQPPRRCYARV